MPSLKPILKRPFKPFARWVLRAVRPLLSSALEKLRQEEESLRKERLLGQLQSCGWGVRINGSLFISDPQYVSIGNNVHIWKMYLVY